MTLPEMAAQAAQQQEAARKQQLAQQQAAARGPQMVAVGPGQAMAVPPGYTLLVPTNAVPDLGGAWRFNSDFTNCTMTFTPRTAGAGSIRAPIECFEFSSLQSYELRGTELLLFDAFGSKARFTFAGSFWSGATSSGRVATLQR